MKFGAYLIGGVAAFLLTVAMLFTAGWTRPPVDSQPTGFRGTAMDKIANPGAEAALKLANALPEIEIPPASPDGKKASEIYKNVQVLGDLSEEQFNRVMVSIALWVAPQDGPSAGCAYCHNVENMADDTLYTKRVARRMLQMTRHINTDWKQHVALVGVTCYTCHRGMPVPSRVWYHDQGPEHAGGFSETNYSMGHPNKVAGDASLPADALGPTLEGDAEIRVQGARDLPGPGMGASIQTTEQTYSLMIYMSESLGVNCTFCHNSRALSNWAQSTPQRVTAWYGIRLARDLNDNYLDPLKTTFPAYRLGPLGDVAKIGCATCHQGISKPLYGVSMAKDYPELGGAPQP